MSNGSASDEESEYPNIRNRKRPGYSGILGFVSVGKD
jgi:hypothetical protein